MREQGPVLIVDHTGLHPNNLDSAIREQDIYYGRTTMRPQERGHAAEPSKNPSTNEPSAALREIAGRMNKLTYREMQTLKDAFRTCLSREGIHIEDDDGMIEGLLNAAAQLEKA